jgi:hypothetical protein
LLTGMPLAPPVLLLNHRSLHRPNKVSVRLYPSARSHALSGERWVLLTLPVSLLNASSLQIPIEYAIPCSSFGATAGLYSSASLTFVPVLTLRRQFAGPRCHFSMYFLDNCTGPH